MFKLHKLLSLSLVMVLGASFVCNVSILDTGASAATTSIITIDPSLQYQKMDGFGTSLSWWAKLVGDWNTNAKNEIMDLAFDKDKGLGLNIVRYNIGGSKSPLDTNLRAGGDIESYLLEDGTYDWTKDAGQRWTLNEAKKRIEDGGDKLIAEAFSNSPPYFMTKSGQATGYDSSGSSNLDKSKYDGFADYLTNVVKHFESNFGITFDTLEPMNEPSSGFWKKGGNQEGCNFITASEKDGMYKALSDKVKQSGITTKIAGFDETSLSQSITSINNVNDETLDTISQLNTHLYSGSNSERIKLRDKAASLGKPLYMDETCISGPSVHDHDNMSNGLQLADIIFNDLKYMKVPAWDIWQVVDDESMNQKNKSNWGLIHAYWDETSESSNYEKYYLTKQYYAMAQFSKYIRPGYIIVDSNSDDVLAAIDPKTNNLVLVTKNESSSDKSLTFDLSKFNTLGAQVKAYRTTNTESLQETSSAALVDGRLNDILPEKSMVTYVISNASYNGEVGTIINDNVIGNDLNQFNYSDTTWSYYDSQSSAYCNDVHYTNTKDDYCQVKFNGNRLKLYGAYNSDAGIAGVSIDGGAETMVDLYSSTRSDNTLIYTSPILAEGDHTIKVRVTGNKNDAATSNYITIDRAIALKNSSDEKVLESPQLVSLTSANKSLRVKFNAVDGATSYNIKYGTDEGSYEKVINGITDTSYTISGLKNETKYYVVVSAVSNSVESINSNELSETPSLPTSNTIYYVNCGDSTPEVLESGEEFGIYNSKEDQAYGLDYSTGYTWGYIADDGSTWSQDAQDTYGAGYGCIRQYDKTTIGKGLTYKFEVPNGKYNISMGFYDPWSSNKRLEDILINGTVVASNFCPNQKGKSEQNYSADVQNGNLTVKVQNSATANDKPLISWIKITKLTHNVIYDANGGIGSLIEDDVNYTANDIAVIKECTLSREGYEFVGWNTSADGSGTNYNSNDSIKIEDSDIVLYAKWQVSSSLVTTPAAVEIIRNDDVLKAELLNADGSEFTTDAAVKYDWYRNDEKLEGENNNTYNLTINDKGKNIKVKVEKYNLESTWLYIDNEESSEATPVAAEITGIEKVGNTLEGELLTNEGKIFTTSAAVNYEWYRLDELNSEFTNNIGNDKNYVLTNYDYGKFIGLIAVVDGKSFKCISGVIYSNTSGSSSTSHHHYITTSDEQTTSNNKDPQNSQSTIANGWSENLGKWQYFKNGKLCTGWNKIKDTWYLFDSIGTMQIGWKKVDGVWYLLNDNGAMETGWKEVNGVWYFLKDNGEMATGWQEINGRWYLLKDDGSMVIGWQESNGEWYYLDQDGSMESSTTIDGYTLGSEGNLDM